MYYNGKQDKKKSVCDNFRKSYKYLNSLTEYNKEFSKCDNILFYNIIFYHFIRSRHRQYFYLI